LLSIPLLAQCEPSSITNGVQITTAAFSVCVSIRFVIYETATQSVLGIITVIISIYETATQPVLGIITIIISFTFRLPLEIPIWFITHESAAQSVLGIITVIFSFTIG